MSSEPATLDAQALRSGSPASVRRPDLHALRSTGFIVGGVLVACWIAVALTWRWLTPQDPFAVDPLNTLQSPSADHWFGTDDLGRDVFSRVLAGSESVLIIAPAVTALCLVLGGVVGMVSGYFRGFVDDAIMRVVDAFISFPAIIISVLVLGLLGPSVTNVIIVIGLLFSPYVARTARAALIAEREAGYVDAARMRGERAAYIMWIEILPNIRGPLLVEATVRFGYAVLAAASLSFLGLGLQRPSPDWGLTIALQTPFMQVAPWTVLFPALALASLLIGINLATDALHGAGKE